MVLDIDSGTATLVSGGIAAFLAINSFFFSWLRNSFNNLSTEIKYHEDKGNLRHEENLRRFEKISVALAKIGSDVVNGNGTYSRST